jgi:glycosyltransferase involved in cell wall biosynthesis
LHHERLESLFSRALVESMPDVVHFLHLAGLSPRSVEIAHRLGIPIVIEIHDFYFACPIVHLQKLSGELCDGPDGGRECARTCFADGDPMTLIRWGLRHTYFRRLLELAQEVVCPSSYVASVFGEQLGVDPQRMRVLPNGLSISPPPVAENSRLSPRQSGALRLACIGTVIAHKGVHLLLEALRLAALDSVELTVFGSLVDSDYAARLRGLADQIPGLTMTLYGSYERENLPTLLSEVDFVVMPSLVAEAGPIAPREAMACGVPVIASRLGALPELVVDGKNGLTFDHRRPADLASVLRRTMDDDDLVRRLRRGVRWAKSPTVHDRMEALRAVYEHAIDDVARDTTSNESELAFLHQALLDFGLGSGTPVFAAASEEVHV